MKNILIKVLYIIVIIFALIGLFLTLGYLAVLLHLTDTQGIVDNQNQAFQASGTTTSIVASSTDNLNASTWEGIPEWTTLSEAMTKDTGLIIHVSNVTGVPPRLIAAQLVAEQLRLYTSEREVYKEFFAPLKILGTQSQFSLGILGFKEDTAIAVENNLKDPTSQYYPGQSYEHLLDFSTTDVNTERFNRLTDDHYYYYDYLYAALYIKEVETQWMNAGFDISNNIGVISTLYNIGFAHSNPNANPQVGGAEIDIASSTWSFGSLAASFYNSNELLEELPR